MDKFINRKALSESGASALTRNVSTNASTATSAPTTNASTDTPRLIDVDNLSWDPSERPKCISYDPNQRDDIRRL